MQHTSIFHAQTQGKDFEEAPAKVPVVDGQRARTSLVLGAWIPGAWCLSKEALLPWRPTMVDLREQPFVN